jgi:hypothetical protein
LKQIVLIALISGIMTLSGCTTEKAPTPQQQIPAITLSPADKEKLMAFQNEILNVENLANKAVKFAVDELKKSIITGGEISVSLPSLIDKAKMECLQAAELLAKKAIPEALPPEAKNLLVESKAGLIAAYKTYVESFDAITNFIGEKNPMALLEYRKKNALAQEQLSLATNKLKQIMTAAGISQ